MINVSVSVDEEKEAVHKTMCIVSKDSADTFRLLQSKETKQSLQVTAKTKWSRVTDPVSYLKIFYFNSKLFFTKEHFYGLFRCCLFVDYGVALFFSYLASKGPQLQQSGLV